MIAFITLCMVVLPGMLLVLICGLIEWLIGKLDKQDKLLGWYAGDTLGNARTVKEAQKALYESQVKEIEELKDGIRDIISRAQNMVK